MKAVNCQSVCLEVEEAEPGWKPGEAVLAHLSSCGQCQSFYVERAKLRQLVGGLGTVRAPADFDFRLRARLANEKPGLDHPFEWAGFSLGFRSVTLATLILLLGAVLLFRVVRIRPESPVANVESPKSNSAAVTPKETGLPTDTTTASDRVDRETVVRENPNRNNTQRRRAVATNTRITSKDFSSQPAQVVKRQDSAASVFPIDASHEFLKMSLDDSSGVSRTISVPRVSFGSQRLVAGESTSMVKTSAKGVW